jgi:phage shock protein E
VKVAPADGAALIDSMGAELTIIDVRTPEEFAAGHLDGAVNYDIEGGQFSALIADLPTDGAYIVYCHSGRRSAIAAQTMIDAGFTTVYDLGGIVDWQAAGLPVVTG